MDTNHERARRSAGAFAFGTHFPSRADGDCLTDARHDPAIGRFAGTHRFGFTRRTSALRGARQLRGSGGTAARRGTAIGDAVATTQRGGAPADWRARRRRLEFPGGCDAAGVSGGSCVERGGGIRRRVCHSVATICVHHVVGGRRGHRGLFPSPARRRPYTGRARRSPLRGRAASAVSDIGNRTRSWYTPCFSASAREQDAGAGVVLS